VLDSERHRIARELHDSVTQYALSAGMHIELARTEVADPRLRTHLDTAKDLTRRAVEQLRSAIYALHHGEGEADEDLPSMLRRLSGVHMPDELRVEVRIGGEPVPLSPECEQSLFRIAGEALFNTAVHADASRAVVRLAYSGGRVRLTISDDGCGTSRGGAAAACGRRASPARRRAPRAGQHGGAGPRAGGTLTFRRARLGGLQVQVDIPTPCAERGAAERQAGTRVRGDEDHGREGDGPGQGSGDRRGRRPRAPGSRPMPTRIVLGRRPRDHAAGPAGGAGTGGRPARRRRGRDAHRSRWPRWPRRARTSSCSTSSSPRVRRPTASEVCRRLCAAHPVSGCWC
jgi:hypothetical protein